MLPLPLANILHHKLRSALAMLGVAIAVCMLVTLSGLSRGSLEEIADRWQAVDADMIVYPATWGENITTVSGGGMGDADISRILALTAAEKPPATAASQQGVASAGDAALDANRTVTGETPVEHMGETPMLRTASAPAKPLFERVVPVFIYQVAIGKDRHNVVGVRPEDLPILLGKNGFDAGRVFDPQNSFAQWVTQRLAKQSDEVIDLSDELAKHGGLEMVIDSRLARVIKAKVGSNIHAAGHDFTVTGIVHEGGLARGFIALDSAEVLFNGRLGRYTLLFAKLTPGVEMGQAMQAVRATKRLTAVGTSEYRGMLQQQFGVMYTYVDLVNLITLIVAFLFILVTLYTMVIQRTREIAILKSMGASRGYILRGVVAESLLLTCIGAAAGIGMSFGAGWLIERVKPLLTVTITPHWLVIGAAAAIVGGTVSALYPAWCAMRVDVIEAINLE